MKNVKMLLLHLNFQYQEILQNIKIQQQNLKIVLNKNDIFI